MTHFGNSCARWRTNRTVIVRGTGRDSRLEEPVRAFPLGELGQTRGRRFESFRARRLPLGQESGPRCQMARRHFLRMT
jgi:hypothetical protein